MNFMINVINWIGEFFTNIVRDFLNIYVDEKQIRESYGDEYADRYSYLHPVTGKRYKSITKILKRVVIVFIVAFWVIIAVRMATYDGLF